jgi:hypothetical protein
VLNFLKGRCVRPRSTIGQLRNKLQTR